MKTYSYFLTTCLLLLLSLSAKSQTAAADNKVLESITFSEPQKGPTLFGVFEGRTPCCEISTQLHAPTIPNLDRLKWQLFLYVDSVTKQPTNYTLRSELFDNRPLTGKWKIIHGLKNKPLAVVLQLEYGALGRSIYFLMGDNNVLFFMDEKFELRVGDSDYNYTLSRVKKVMRLTGK